MIRHHITIIEAEPNGEVLRQYQRKVGFRLFFEKHTGLYYLDFPDAKNQNYQNSADFTSPF